MYYAERIRKSILFSCAFLFLGLSFRYKTIYASLFYPFRDSEKTLPLRLNEDNFTYSAVVFLTTFILSSSLLQYIYE